MWVVSWLSPHWWPPSLTSLEEVSSFFVLVLALVKSLLKNRLILKINLEGLKLANKLIPKKKTLSQNAPKISACQTNQIKPAGKSFWHGRQNFWKRLPLQFTILFSFLLAQYLKTPITSSCKSFRFADCLRLLIKNKQKPNQNLSKKSGHWKRLLKMFNILILFHLALTVCFWLFP